jgi:hypothetical protein
MKFGLRLISAQRRNLAFSTALLLAVVAVLTGCEPSPGRVIEEKSKRVRSLEIVLRRHAEGTWGNAAQGEHYRAYCRSPETRSLRHGEDTIGYLYLTPPHFLKSLPIERIHVVSDRLAWGSVYPFTVFVTFNACATVEYLRWDMLPRELRDDTRQDLSGFEEPFFQAATFEPPNGVRLALNPAWFKHGQRVEIVTQDRFKTWQVVQAGEGRAPEKTGGGNSQDTHSSPSK